MSLEQTLESLLRRNRQPRKETMAWSTLLEATRRPTNGRPELPLASAILQLS